MKIKRITAAVILSSLAIGISVSAAEFADTKGHWAEEMINKLADAGVVHGVSDTEFNPEGTITRAEFLKMAMGAVSIEEVPLRSGECLDVTASEWYGPYVQSALDKGLIPEGMVGSYAEKIVETEEGSKAVYSGYFSGNTPIKREEMAYLVSSLYQYSLDEDSAFDMYPLEDLYFTDVSSISSWAFDGVSHAFAEGFIAGMEDDTFRPKDTATRAQAATIISKLLDKVD